jgi:hypothetical protein
LQLKLNREFDASAIGMIDIKTLLLVLLLRVEMSFKSIVKVREWKIFSFKLSNVSIFVRNQKHKKIFYVV